MKNSQSQLNFIFLTTLFVILIWMASTSAKGYTQDKVMDFPLADYEAHYTVRWHGFFSGDSMHKLRRRPNGQYHFETRTAPSVKFLPFHYVECSDFIWEAGKILPQQYSYNIQEGKRQKIGNVRFDRVKNKLTNRYTTLPWEVDLPANVQDKLTQTLSLRQSLLTGSSDLSYTVAEEDKVKNYSFVVLGKENLPTKLGTLETLKVEHISRKGHRTTLWLAKRYDYLPVRMTQVRNGKIVASGDINSYQHLK